MPPAAPRVQSASRKPVGGKRPQYSQFVDVEFAAELEGMIGILYHLYRLQGTRRRKKELPSQATACRMMMGTAYRHSFMPRGKGTIRFQKQSLFKKIRAEYFPLYCFMGRTASIFFDKKN